MSDTLKKVLLIATVVVAVALVAFQAVKMSAGDKQEVVGTVQAGSPGHTMKTAELAAQNAQTHARGHETDADKSAEAREAALAGK
ncbi:hypothetical protein [Fimbriimonas ginsengisoli]|uniref:Uncharacterized protein n=1 Tax=Fimbriimonas ginsengisoli Gsoil 348 TaxID=661478 RepID=A0A068NW88_FIMGI|nr:hypothetical protein [Fimbriimonas ginsengisoli]AIE87607.1 hypothetical protein OP10G_4239 [Fimbriimonas ginsengisoli Gsoil 348]